MANLVPTCTREVVNLAGSQIELVTAGSGEPLLLLHDELGHHQWLKFHDELAQRHTLSIPSHPGFGASERLDWMMTVRDLAGWYLHALDDLNIGPVNVLGLSFGGWLAAEMASMCPQQFKKLVLVSPPGIRPPQGEIFDMFLVIAQDYIKQCFHEPTSIPELARVLPDDPPRELRSSWELAREQTCRLTWKPYMHDPALPHLLKRVTSLPTMLVWGRQDSVVPLSAGEAYQEAIQGSQLVVLENCGHRPEIEKTDEFVRTVNDFIAG